VASRALRVIRPLAVIGSLIASLVIVSTVSTPATATPNTRPTIESVRKQLDVLARKNSQIVDKYDGAQIHVTQRTAAAASAAKQSVLAKHRYTAAHRQLVQVIQNQYMGSDLGAAGALLDSDSTGNYLDRLDLLNLVSIQTAEVVKNTTKTRAAATKAADTATTLLDRAKGERAELRKQKGDVEKQITKYKSLLATLTAEQRAAYLRAQQARAAAARAAAQQVTTDTAGTHKTKRGSDPVPTFTITGAPSAKALIAVKYAIAQVGKPYVYAADGPGSYDCSGLTMASWRAAGVHLPHQASAQYSHGHHVTLSQLLPGDLVFYYQPIGHVSMYIGNGTLVSAPQPGQNVEFVKLKSTLGDFTGATRVG
jgi:cell wall-associated NlpC family hydrolase